MARHTISSVGAVPAEKLERFQAHIAKTDGCWEWQGFRHPRGYGMFKLNNRSWYAHRLNWILTNGDLPEGLFVCHRCDNPPCCNPEHLFVGTNADNCQDRHAKGRTKNIDLGRAKLHEAMRSRKFCKRGHEYTPENTRVRGNTRHCRACRMARYYATGQ